MAPLLSESDAAQQQESEDTEEETDETETRPQVSQCTICTLCRASCDVDTNDMLTLMTDTNVVEIYFQIHIMLVCHELYWSSTPLCIIDEHAK